MSREKKKTHTHPNENEPLTNRRGGRDEQDESTSLVLVRVVGRIAQRNASEHALLAFG